MTRKEFLMELDRRLDILPREDADKYLNYYAEMLADRMEDGMTEEEAVASMEPLDTIINRILGEWYTTPRKPKLPLRRIAAIAAIIVVAVCVAVSVRHLVYQAMFGILRNNTISGSYATETLISVEGAETDTENNPIPSVEYRTDSGMVIPADGIRSLSIHWVSDEVQILPSNADDTIFIECDHTVSAEVQGDTLVIGNQLLSNASGSLSVFLPWTLIENLETLSVSVTSADVQIDNIDAQTLILSTTSGDCTVEGTFDTAEIRTTSANVTLCGSVEHVTADAISGSLMLDMNYALQTLLASTVSGDIELNFPIDLGYTVDFDTSSGYLYTDERYYSGSISNFTYGDGTATLNISTVSGNVFLNTY